MSKKLSRNSVKLRIGCAENDQQSFKALIHHPMETGFRRDKKSGALIPADYIKELMLSVDGKAYIEMILSTNVSRNPFFHFMFSCALFDNQKVEFRWVDNNNRVTSYEFFVAFDAGGKFAFSAEPALPENYVDVVADPPICRTRSYTVRQ